MAAKTLRRRLWHAVCNCLAHLGRLVSAPCADGKLVVSQDNYQGVAHRNSATGEIVIANRGTQPTHFKDLWNDAKLATHVEPRSAIDAINFARTVAANYPSATITETGHSLGGYEAGARPCSRYL